MNLFAGGGFNSVDVIDTVNGFATDYTLTGSKLTRRIIGQTVTAQINFADVDDLDVFGGSGVNVYDVQGVAAITELTLDGGQRERPVQVRRGEQHERPPRDRERQRQRRVRFHRRARLGKRRSDDIFPLGRRADAADQRPAGPTQVSYTGVEDVDMFGGSAAQYLQRPLEQRAARTVRLIGGAGNDLFQIGWERTSTRSTGS